MNCHCDILQVISLKMMKMINQEIQNEKNIKSKKQKASQYKKQDLNWNKNFKSMTQSQLPFMIGPNSINS